MDYRCSLSAPGASTYACDIARSKDNYVEKGRKKGEYVREEREIERLESENVK